jgi:hypothetical protein
MAPISSRLNVSLIACALLNLDHPVFLIIAIGHDDKSIMNNAIDHAHSGGDAKRPTPPVLGGDPEPSLSAAELRIPIEFREELVTSRPSGRDYSPKAFKTCAEWSYRAMTQALCSPDAQAWFITLTYALTYENIDIHPERARRHLAAYVKRLRKFQKVKHQAARDLVAERIRECRRNGPISVSRVRLIKQQHIKESCKLHYFSCLERGTQGTRRLHLHLFVLVPYGS